MLETLTQSLARFAQAAQLTRKPQTVICAHLDADGTILYKETVENFDLPEDNEQQTRTTSRAAGFVIDRFEKYADKKREPRWLERLEDSEELQPGVKATLRAALPHLVEVFSTEKHLVVPMLNGVSARSLLRPGEQAEHLQSYALGTSKLISTNLESQSYHPDCGRRTEPLPEVESTNYALALKYLTEKIGKKLRSAVRLGELHLVFWSADQAAGPALVQCFDAPEGETAAASLHRQLYAGKGASPTEVNYALLVLKKGRIDVLDFGASSFALLQENIAAFNKLTGLPWWKIQSDVKSLAKKRGGNPLGSKGNEQAGLDMLLKRAPVSAPLLRFVAANIADHPLPALQALAKVAAERNTVRNLPQATAVKLGKYLGTLDVIARAYHREKGHRDGLLPAQTRLQLLCTAPLRVLRGTLESTAKYIGKYRSLDAQLKVNALSDEEQQLLQKPLTDADFIALMTAYHATLA